MQPCVFALFISFVHSFNVRRCILKWSGKKKHMAFLSSRTINPLVRIGLLSVKRNGKSLNIRIHTHTKSVSNKNGKNVFIVLFALVFCSAVYFVLSISFSLFCTFPTIFFLFVQFSKQSILFTIYFFQFTLVS